jgi:hypothetical protein
MAFVLQRGINKQVFCKHQFPFVAFAFMNGTIHGSINRGLFIKPSEALLH